MIIWIDIINASHALFFNSIIKEFKSKNIVVTIRERAETVDLVKSFGIEGKVIGKYYRDSIKKSLTMIQRTIELNFKIGDFDISLSFENGMNVAVSKFRNKKSILFCDNDLKFIQKVALIQKLETKIKSMADFLVIPEACYDNFRAHKKRGTIGTYRGYKEDVYIADFIPDVQFMEKIPFDNFVAIRPEDSDSFYVKDKRSIVPELLQLFQREGINVIYLPREKEDANYAKGSKAYIPKETLNGLDLVYYADATLTGSGTMAREAACMDKTAVSFFPSKELLSVDRQLINDRKIFHSRNPKEIVEYILSTSRKKNLAMFDRSKIVKKDVIKLISTYFEDNLEET